ncbi:DUF5753 domain-containing protein [Micromonospora inyonensis]|uniref:DUF5753 domain-containing protein n=1 Tax=Micromonospora inyonensis TaxID=47866 RepID=UPI001FDF299C|nr:DUF5753 domain-containing protein [Micromonospora inyonensis]
MSAVENGLKPPKPDFLRAVDVALDTDGLLLNLWEDLVRDSGAPVWFRDWIQVEREAVSLCWYEMAVVPGLLQTEAYARAIFASGGLLKADEIERRLGARVARQDVLTRENAPQFVAVLDESLLRRAVGGPAVMREQLFHLLDLSNALPHVRLHVVPSMAGAYAGLSGPFVLATLAGGDDVAYLDNQYRGQVVDDPSALIWLRQAWESIRGEALPYGQSAKLIMEVAEQWN